MKSSNPYRPVAQFSFPWNKTSGNPESPEDTAWPWIRLMFPPIVFALILIFDLRLPLSIIALILLYVIWEIAERYWLARLLGYKSYLNNSLLEILPQLSVFSAWEHVVYRASVLLSFLFNRRTNAIIVSNVLILSQDELFLTASSSEDGQSLARENPHTPIQLGITDWVVRNKRECFIQDTGADPEKRYLQHAVFSNMQSAMAAPIKYGNNIVGVIDVESSRKNAFIEEDVIILKFLGLYLGEIYRQTKLLDIQRQLAQLSVKLAERVITIHDLGVLLREIGQVVKDILGADIVSYYFVDPEDAKLRGPYVAGDLLHPEVQITEEDVASDKFLYQVLQHKEIKHFENAVDYINEYNFENHERPPFVIREKILSFAAIPLYTDRDKIGLMFVNYRSRKEFDGDFLSLIEIFASLASLAMQSCLLDEMNAMAKHEQLIRDLHSTVQHRLLGAEDALNNLLRESQYSDLWKESGLAALSYLGSARKIVYRLQHGEDIFTLKTILEHLKWHTNLIKKIYKIDVDLDLPRSDDVPVVAWMGGQIEHVLEETLYNAVHHAETKKIDVKVELQDGQMSVIIKDYGIGFIPEVVNRGLGLNDIRQRVEVYLNGSLQIQSGTNQGTEVSITFPFAEDF